jgi:alpha-1,6-mannosyltransferase
VEGEPGLAVAVRVAAQSDAGPLVVADVTLLYGARGGGVRTYLEEKARFAADTGSFDHHVIVPARRERHSGGRHELRAVRMVASNGYRIPLGAGSLKATLRAIRPDVVMLHDQYWRPGGVSREAHRLGATVIAVHHASPAMNAAGLPGPAALYLPLLRRVFRHAYEGVDAVMSFVDTRGASGRAATFPLRLGLDPAFRPAPATRGDHVLCVGRLALEKDLDVLLEAAALAPERWPLHLVGEGPMRRALALRAERLGIAERVSFHPFVSERVTLARLYREASCVVMPGPHETFGLVAVEAAASGASVVTCRTAPSLRVLGRLAQTYPPGDAAGLAEAIGRARAARGDAAAALALAHRMSWRQALKAELEDVLALLA